jgi:hypothetical protein
MRSGLLVLLVATLMHSVVPSDPPPVAVLAPGRTSLEAPAIAVAAQDSSFARGNLADVLVTQRAGYIPVQVWGSDSPLSGVDVAMLPFAKLGEVMTEIDLWPFIITEEVVLKFGQRLKTDQNGVAHIALREGPCYVAAQVGTPSAMATLIPQTWDGEVVRLWLRVEPPLQVLVHYANGQAVVGVPVYLGCADAGNNALLLGEERRQRTSLSGSATFSLTASARRILGSSGQVDAEVAALAPALGYAAGDLDTLLTSALFVVVPVFAGERLAVALPTPFDFSVPVQLQLSEAGSLVMHVFGAEGQFLDSHAEISEVSSGRPQRNSQRDFVYAFAVPAGRATLASLAIHKKYRVEVQVMGIGGKMIRDFDGPQSSGDSVLLEFVPDNVARVGALLVDAGGQALVSTQVTLAFFSQGRREELAVVTDEKGRLEAFVPSVLAAKPLTAIEILDGYFERDSPADSVSPGQADAGANGKMRKLRSTRIALQGVLASFEDLGTLTLK